MSVQLGLAMPQPGETITEGVVIRWIKKEGEMIKEKEPVVELETAKAVYEFESPLEGQLVKILVQPNETQQVGKPLAVIECDDANAKKYMMFGVAVPLKGAAKPALAPVAATAPVAAPHAVTPTAAGGIQYPPLIRTLAQENSIPFSELSKITPTGPGGKLTKEDVLSYAKARGASLPRTEVSPIRKRIAENLHLSKTVIPHAGSAVDIDCTALVQLREAKKEAFQKKNGVSLSFGPFFMTAVLEALKKYPQANSSYIIDGDKQYMEAHDSVNIGFAVGARQGLVVPVVRNAQSRSFADLAKGVSTLVTKAQENKLAPDDLTGGTITVNNPGALGSTRGNQIIVYPQAIIVGFQKMMERPAVVNGKIEIRTIMECGCSFDHRILDGVEAVGFLEVIRNVLENPGRYFSSL